MNFKGDIAGPNATVFADGHIVTPNLTVATDGSITSPGFNVTALGVLTGVTKVQLPAGAFQYLGSFTSDPGGLTTADKGLVWFNSTSNTFKGWTGTGTVNLSAPGTGPGTNVGGWAKFTVAFGALSFAGLTNSVTLFSLPSLGFVERVVIHHTTSFTGGSISAYTVSIGVTGDLSKYASAFDVFQATGSNIGEASNRPNMEDFASPTNILITATSTGDNLSSATQGSVDVYVRYSSVV